MASSDLAAEIVILLRQPVPLTRLGCCQNLRQKTGRRLQPGVAGLVIIRGRLQLNLRSGPARQVGARLPLSPSGLVWHMDGPSQRLDRIRNPEASGFIAAEGGRVSLVYFDAGALSAGSREPAG